MLPHLSSSQLGWITTIAVFLIFGVGIPIGALVDRYGTRPVVAPFAALGVLALGLLSLCKEYWQVMLCQGVLFGLACSGTTLPAVVCVTQWFSTRRGLAVGIASCASSFGGLIYPIMVSRLINSHGFAPAVKWSTLVVGCGMATGVLCCEGPFPPKRARVKAEQHKDVVLSESNSAAVTDTEPEKPEKAEDPEKGGHPTSSQTGHQGDNDGPIELGDLSEPTPSSDPPQPKSGHLEPLRYNGSAWMAFCAGAFFCTFSLLVPFNYLPEMGVESGMSVSLSQYTLAIINAGSMVGRVLPGFLSDHLGQFNVMAIVSAASAIAMLAIWLPLNYYPSDAGIIFFGAFYGFVSGGYTSLLSPCVVSLVDDRVTNRLYLSSDRVCHLYPLPQ
jgi:MCP family monocarboxylic acid transporter-like MFS transporter 10